MKYIITILFLPIMVCAQPLIVTDQSERDVGLNVTYDGSDILVYGALRNAEDIDDIVIVVEGPDRPFELRKLSQKYQLWLPERRHKFTAPSFYAILSQNQNSLAYDSETIQIHGLLHHKSLKNLPILEKDKFIQLQEESGLYQEVAGAITLRQQLLFSAHIELPADVVEGDYRIKYLLIKNGHIQAVNENRLYLRREGVTAFFERMAREYSWVYGLLTIFTAVFLSLSMGILMREMRL